jgi:hypothetical protein
MNNYTCFNCNRNFNKKCHLDDHLNKKKKPCCNINVIMDTTNTIISDQTPQNLTLIPQNLALIPQNLTLIPQKFASDYDDKNANNTINNTIQDDLCIKKYKCTYCEKLYSRTDSLSRHIEDFCKNKKHFDNVEAIQSKINNSVIVADDKYEKLVSENEKLIEMLEGYKQFIKNNDLLKNTIPNILTNTNNNNNNNGSINNGVVNNGAINSGNTINIVQFGKEDISKCNLIEMMNNYLKSTGGNIFPNFLKYLNFNPNFPENFNISMGDLARENVQIHNGQKFVTKKFKNVKNDILNVLGGHITNMCDRYIKNPKIKKNKDVLSKMKINDISIKLITNDDITPILRIDNVKIDKVKKNKNKVGLDNDNNNDNDNDSEESDESDVDYLDDVQQKKLVHYEEKRIGLQEITMNKLKDELYNNRDMVHKRR